MRDQIKFDLILNPIQVQQGMDTLLEWLSETDRKLQNSAREKISVDPDGVRDQLKKAKVRHEPHENTSCRSKQ